MYIFISKQAFFGQNPSYSSKFSELARIFLDYRAILAREIYIILLSSIDILYIHVHIFRHSRSQSNSDFLVAWNSE